MKNIKNLLVVSILSIVLIPTAWGQVQFSKDTLAVDGYKVGFISNVVVAERTIIKQGRALTGPVTEYTVTLFHPVTLIQKRNLFFKNSHLFSGSIIIFLFCVSFNFF